MKKKTLIMILSALLAIALLAGGVIIYYNSPLRALKTMYDDLDEQGIDGLRPHFTDDAAELYDTLMEATDDWVVKKLLERTGLDLYVDAFKNHSKDIRWEFEDLLKGSSRTDVYVRFSYNEEVEGLLELRLIKEDGDWKIDGFGLPELDEFELSDLF